MGHIAHLRKQFKSINTYDLNKLESPSPKDALCQVGLKLAQWFWRSGEYFLISSMYFSYIVIISPWKRTGPFI